MRNYLADFDLFAVSANLKETALNTEQTLDTTLLIAKSDIVDVKHRREDNSDEATGKEEPDTMYNLGATMEKSINFNKAQAQHFALALSYGLGVSTPSAWGTGYKQAITPTGGLVLPSFTGAKRFGKIIGKRRLASIFVDTLTATFEKDTWAKLALGIKSTGKYTDTVSTETVTAAYNATSLTLAANAIQGSTAADRLDSVHRIRVLVPTTAEWKEVTFSAASAATPAVITISAPGGAATSTSYEILYVATEAAWATFPARVTEPPLRVSDLVVKIGGKWDGSAFNGGRTLSDEIDKVEYNLNNQLDIQFRPGGTGAYANYTIRGGRVQTLKLSRQMREFILQRAIIDNEYFGVSLKATGAEFESGKNYYVELIFPRCCVLDAPIVVADKVLGEEGDLKIMEDDTYGSVLGWVGNKVSGYAQ